LDFISLHYLNITLITQKLGQEVCGIGK